MKLWGYELLSSWLPTYPYHDYYFAPLPVPSHQLYAGQEANWTLTAGLITVVDPTIH